jgi:hypothetical protein
MINIIVSLSFVYVFILLGYIAKKVFKDDINPKTLTLVSVYFTQPFVAMWGFSSATLKMSHLEVVFIYLSIIIAILIPTIYIAKFIFDDPKERAIFSIAGLLGNTGNIGIPLGIAIFGQSSVIYTTVINLTNVFVAYILGVYIYSRGSFDIKTSLKNIIKIPIIPVSIVAIIINILGIDLSVDFKEFLKMGAYAGIVLQLFLLGTFLQGIKIKEIHPKLFVGTLAQKFILIPILSVLLLSMIEMNTTTRAIVLMEMLTPLAIANINLSSLYECRPKDVTALIFLSTILFIPIIYIFICLVK